MITISVSIRNVTSGQNTDIKADGSSRPGVLGGDTLQIKGQAKRDGVPFACKVEFVRYSILDIAHKYPEPKGDATTASDGSFLITRVVNDANTSWGDYTNPLVIYAVRRKFT